MPGGRMRTLTLAIGQATLRVAEATHVTWPWDRLAAALGNAPQPAVRPLLASGSAATLRPQAMPTPSPAQTPQAGTVLIGAPPLTSGRRTIQQPLADPPGTQEPTWHPTPTDVAREVRPVLEPKRTLRKDNMPLPIGTSPVTILTVAPMVAHPPTAVATVRSGAVTPSDYQRTNRRPRTAGNC